MEGQKKKKQDDRKQKRIKGYLIEDCQGSTRKSYYIDRGERKYKQEYWKKLKENWW